MTLSGPVFGPQKVWVREDLEGPEKRPTVGWQVGGWKALEGLGGPGGGALRAG